MTTLELKKYLTKRINEINDEAFLEEVKTILDAKATIISISSKQRIDIQKSQVEVKKGQFLTQAEMENEFEKWLSEK